MAETNPQCFHQSASSIAAFKACPQRFRLSYREGLRLRDDTASQRQGTNWHKMHEVYAAALQKAWSQAGVMNAKSKQEDDELLASAKELALTAVVDHLNKVYANCPQAIDATDWALERQVLLTGFIGYLWYWQNDPVEVLASEVPFNLPIIAPKTGLPLPMSQVQRVGKMDHVIRWQGMVGILERKSTSRSIDPSSDYWDKSKKDTQVSMYALAFREMIAKGTLPEGLGAVIAMQAKSVGNTLYDVWHKPTIGPAPLTQGDTAEFIASANPSGLGIYCDQQFAVTTGKLAEPLPPKGAEKGNPITDFVTVNGENCEVTQGKKGFAIRETVDMFGARLLQDIYARPEFYYARREIVRTDKELDKFATEGYNIYQTQRLMDNSGHWYENESACDATFRCQYKPICYGVGADAVCDGKTTPGSYKRIFTPLTVNEHSVEG